MTGVTGIPPGREEESDLRGSAGGGGQGRERFDTANSEDFESMMQYRPGRGSAIRDEYDSQPSTVIAANYPQQRAAARYEKEEEDGIHRRRDLRAGAAHEDMFLDFPIS